MLAGGVNSGQWRVGNMGPHDGEFVTVLRVVLLSPTGAEGVVIITDGTEAGVTVAGGRPLRPVERRFLRR